MTSSQRFGCERPLDVIMALREELDLDPISVREVADMLLWDLGHDGIGLSPANLERAMVLDDEAPWDAVGRACQEQLCSHVCDTPLSDESFWLWVGSACLFSEAVRKGRHQWGASIDLAIHMLFRSKQKCTFAFRVRLTRYLFSC